MMMAKQLMSEYKILPRSKVEQLVTSFIEKNKIYAEYGRDAEGLFVVHFLVDEENDDDDRCRDI